MENQQELSLRDLFALIRRGLVFALAVAVGAAGLTYFLSSRTTPEYDATATVLASRPNATLQGNFGVNLVTAPLIDVSAYQAAARSHTVLTGALNLLGVPSPSPQTVNDFGKLVTVRVETASQSSLLRLTFRDADPVAAAAGANAVARALLDWEDGRATQNLQVIVDTLESQIEALDSEIAQVQQGIVVGSDSVEGLLSLRADRALQLNSARALRTSAVGLLEVLEPAIPPTTASSPRPLRNAALAFVLGIFLVYGLVLLRDALDTRFRNGEDVVRTTELPVLSEFPRLGSGVVHLPREATSYLRTNVLFSTASDHPKVLQVTSAGPNEGKSSVALGLAESLARNDYRTLLIDADLRRPLLYQRLDLTPSVDLEERTLAAHLLNPKSKLEPVMVSVAGVSFDLIPTFKPVADPAELLSRSFPTLIHEMRERYDAIIIDTPPVLPVADSLTMGPHSTGVIFAVSLPETDRRAVVAALDLLDRIGVRLLGTVLTNVEAGSGARGDYGYGYGYGYGANKDPRVTASTGRTAARRVRNTLEADA